MTHDLIEKNSVSAEYAEQQRLKTGVWIAAAVLVLSAAVTYFAIRWGQPIRWGGSASEPLASFHVDLDDQLAIDPGLLRYEQVGTVVLELNEPWAIATGPVDQLYVAGDQAIHIFLPNQDRPQVIELESEPTCLAVGGPEHFAPGQLYVGTNRGIVVFDALHKPVGNWRVPADGSVLTSLAIAENDVFVADAGNRVVWRFSPSGELLGEIGKPDPARGVPGFVVSSPQFDVALGSAGLIHVVNPGKLQIATCTFDGDFGAAWGRASSTIDGFFGCCNPTHIAVLPDGRFVTSEKGIPRIKTYDPTGKLLAVVAGPRQLDIPKHAIGDPRCTQDESKLDIAVDRQGHVLALDARNKIVRIFAEAK